ncbi:hypothetical protein C1646_756069 [Rhizophagus diaphanus]|nr:hypothetical protein C1646_756069 [Rhizophagus diaphanus] [Rhizophagus sp. MUCL 43196]
MRIRRNEKTKILVYPQVADMGDNVINKKEIKQQLRNKRGYTPKWYQYLLDNIVLNQNNLCFTFDVSSIKVYKPQVDHPKIILPSLEIRRVKNSWITYWCPRIKDIIFGRIVEKNSLILSNSLKQKLLMLTHKLSNFNELEFYTDSSLSREEDMLKMGYGWIFSTDLTLNIKHLGSATEWASSSKVELIAIITALITCPLQSHVNIYTDSANCIATFNKLSSPKLTALKAHSNNPLNDTADLLAKEDWEYSQLWFKYNSFSKPTSQQYSKHVSWKIKCLMLNLPTLDILNRNYPELLYGYDTCFLCENDKETNDHFWNCPKVLNLSHPYS